MRNVVGVLRFRVLLQTTFLSTRAHGQVGYGNLNRETR